MRFTQGLARHKIALLACGAVLCLLVALFGLSVTGIFKIPFLENAVSFVVTPVQGWISDAYASVRSNAEKKSTIAELNEEIAMLTERNRQLEATVAQMSELQKENERLRGLLGVTEVTPDVQYIAASVTAKEPGGWFATFTVDKGEKLCVVIALGYGATQGVPHKSRPFSEVAKADGQMPDWFKNGVEAALLAPTAMNQQKFLFTLSGDKMSAKAGRGFYTKLDLGIVKYHFELGAGKDRFAWA